MNNASLELGGTNWAEKDGNILGYSVGDTSGKYSPQEFTFARGSNLSATRIDRAGLIVKGRENLLLYSNDFSNAAWSTSPITLTSGQSGYDGSNDAWEAEVAVNGNYQSLIQATNTSGLITNSIYAKAGNSNFLGITDSGGSGGSNCIFDLTDGSISYQNGGDFIETSSESIGNGWYRLKVTHQGTSPNYALWFVADASNSTQGTAGDSVFIQDAQQESSLVASPYIESGATNGTAGVLENTPRLNYTTGVANPYLLLEPSRTNLVTQSEYFNDSAWVEQGGVSVISNNSISPEGVQNATSLAWSANDYLYYLIGNTGSQELTLSFWAKGISGETIVSRGNTAASGNQYKTHTFDGTWQRFTQTINGGVYNYVYPFDARSSFTATSMEIYGFQVEIGSYPTSYIPTYSVSATRAADSCSKLDASGEIGQTEGTLFLEFDDLDYSFSSIARGISISDGTYTNRIYIAQLSGGGMYAISSTGCEIQESTPLSRRGTIKVALAYKNNDYIMYVNGIQSGSDTSATVPLCNKLYLGQEIGLDVNCLYKPYNQAALYKERLTNAELATLTTI